MARGVDFGHRVHFGPGYAQNGNGILTDLGIDPADAVEWHQNMSVDVEAVWTV